MLDAESPQHWLRVLKKKKKRIMCTDLQKCCGKIKVISCCVTPSLCVTHNSTQFPVILESETNELMGSLSREMIPYETFVSTKISISTARRLQLCWLTSLQATVTRLVLVPPGETATWRQWFVLFCFPLPNKCTIQRSIRCNKTFWQKLCQNVNLFPPWWNRLFFQGGTMNWYFLNEKLTN